MLKIPYGESDFKLLALGDYFYQDRTQFIEKLENWSAKYQVFLRPRRFGKSLFISTLHHYYGLEHKADFESLFGKFDIGKNPTPEANTYLVLSFEFSRINTVTEQSTFDGFLTNVLLGASSFFSAYRTFFTEEEIKAVLSIKTPEGVLKSLFTLVSIKGIDRKIYILIDEYDHFANELLSFDMTRFRDNVSRNGWVRKFYESLKTGTRDGVVGRIFITGVSPITLDSLTSGFNISDNISMNPLFHDVMGFKAAEIKEMLHQEGINEKQVEPLMDDLKAWYNGYNFHPRIEHALFNPDMVLYFLKEYRIMHEYPEVMLDSNVISDYRKVRNMFKIGGEETGRFELLQKLVEDGYIDFPLTRLYNLEAPFTDDDFLSLLFYLGMLSCRGFAAGGWRFEVPNYVIKKLYFEYFAAIYLESSRLGSSRRALLEAIQNFIGKGEPELFFKLVEQVLSDNHSNRDELSYSEKHLQTLVIGLLYPYENYFIHSEYEARKGYPDIFLERLHEGRGMPKDIVLELKYVKKSKEHTLPQVIEQAENQLSEYVKSERFNRPDVIAFYVIFLGGKLHTWKQTKA
jgi:hypothetical protein